MPGHVSKLQQVVEILLTTSSHKSYGSLVAVATEDAELQGSEFGPIWPKLFGYGPCLQMACNTLACTVLYYHLLRVARLSVLLRHLRWAPDGAVTQERLPPSAVAHRVPAHTTQGTTVKLQETCPGLQSMIQAHTSQQAHEQRRG